MESEPTPASPPAIEIAEPLPSPRQTSRALILLELAIFGAVFAWGEWAPLELPISWGGAQISLGKIQSSPPVYGSLAILFLWINGGLRDLDFSWPAQWKRYLWQLLLVLAAFLIVSALATWINHLLLGRSPQADGMRTMLTDPRTKSFFLLILPLWAFTEELFHRAYLIQRFEKLTSPWRHATLLAVLLASLVFACCHLQFGLTKLPVYIFSALLFTGIYLHTKRNLWFVTLIHWLSNTCILAFG